MLHFAFLQNEKETRNFGSIIFRVDGIFPPTLFCVYKKANIHYIKSAET